MADYTAKRIDDMEAVYGGGYKRARAELGVESFGMQVLDFPPNATGYPEHDHRGDRQEEVYVTLRGSGEIIVDGERLALEPSKLVRVGPTARRKLVSGAEGMLILALGGTPGEVYDPPEASKLGTLPMSGPADRG